ncbi:unnamed protein product, partial [Discosporangium mesarthrocarpum]
MALSRVDGNAGQGGPVDGNQGFGGDFHGPDAFGKPQGLTQPEIPLWKRLAVPGALMVGGLGAFGAYRAMAPSLPSHRMACGNRQQVLQPTDPDTPHNSTPVDQLLEGGNNYGNMVGAGSPPCNGTTAGEAENPLQPEAGIYAYDGAAGVRRGGAGATEGVVTLGLAGEFRRLSEAIERQTGQLGEAVGAMKTLAVKAKEDSSSLLAAQVTTQTL